MIMMHTIILNVLPGTPYIAYQDGMTIEEKTEYTATTVVTQELSLVATELVLSIVGTNQYQ